MITYLQTTMVKMTKKSGDWGHKTACGGKFSRGDARLTTSHKWINCSKCIEFLINRKEAEIKYLKWALRDQASIRGIVMGGE